jgi:hypothetical protein
MTRPEDRPWKPLNRGQVDYLDPAQAVQDLDGAAGKAQDQPRPWEIDTPVSRRRLQAQRPKEAQRPAQKAPGPALARHEPTAEERRRARELSRAGLVRTAEEQQRHRHGLDRRLLQRGQPWLPPPPDEAA